MSSHIDYFFTVKRWVEVAPAVAALADSRFERRADLALALGIDDSTLSNWLSGSRTPLLESAFRLVEKVGGSWGQLLGEPVPLVPWETQEAAAELERKADELAKAARNLSKRMSAAGAVPAAQAEETDQRGAALVRDEAEPYLADVVAFRGGTNVDEPRDLHETEMEIVAYAAAGQDRHPEPVATGETVPVINHVFRKAQRGKWKVVKVVGDSMAPEYEPGDMVLIEPARDSTVRTGDVAFVMLNGEGLLKVLDFKRDRDTGRLLNLRLRSLNEGFPEIPVGEGDWFHVIGVEAYRIQGRRSFK